MISSEDSLERRIGALDYVVFFLSLLLSISTGVYHAIRAKFFPQHGTTQKDDYLMGGRKMSKLPVAFSLLTSFLSGILMLGVPAEMYVRGSQIWLNFAIGVVSSMCTAKIFLPMFYKMQSTCLHEYFIHRYKSLLIRRLFSLLFILFTVIYMSVVIYAPSVALSQVVRVNKSLLIIVFGLSTTLYTCIGGLKAVVWADTLQAVIMYAGVSFLIGYGLSHENVGGAGRVFSLAFETGRISEVWRTDLRITQYNSLWINIFSGTITWIASFGVNQISIQRYNSLPSVKDAQTIIYLTLVPFFILCSLVSFIGFIALAFYYQCDPMESGQITDTDHIIILFAYNVLTPHAGLFGLYVSCIMAATLSTLSSGMNSLSAAVYEDFLKQKYDGKLTDYQATLINKGLTIVSGIVSTLLAFTAEPLGGILRVCVSVMGAISGPMVAIFVLALFFPRSGRLSCLVSFILSNVIMTVICVVNYMEDPYKDFFLPTNTTSEGCESLAQHNITYRIPPSYDAHYGNPATSWVARISTYGYAGMGFVLMLAIAIPITFFESEDPKLHYLTFYGLSKPWPKDQHEFDHLTEDVSMSEKRRRRISGSR